jgi:hypothetical protein
MSDCDEKVDENTNTDETVDQESNNNNNKSTYFSLTQKYTESCKNCNGNLRNANL